MIQIRNRLKPFLFLACIAAMCFFLSACEGITEQQDASEFTPSVARCWLCSIYGTVFMIANDFVNNSIAATISVAETILTFGLAFLLLFRIGSMMLFASDDSMIKTLKDTAFIFLKAMMVAILLWGGDLLWGPQAFISFIHDIVIYPIGNFFLMIANAVLDAVPESGQYFGSIPGITPNMNQLIGQVGAFNINTSVFGDLGIQVQYTVSRIYAALDSGFVFVKHMFVIGGVFAWFIGIVMFWQLLNLIIIFPLAFADAFVWLAFYIVFSPICLALWVFPKTSKYLRVIFPAQILTPFLNILFGSIISVLMVSLLQLYSDLALNGIFRQTAQNTNSWIAESAAGGRPPALILLMICIIIRKIAMEVAEFTAKFGGESSDSSFFALINKAVDLTKKGLMTATTIVLGAATGGAASTAIKVAQTAVEAAKKGPDQSSGEGNA